jgi:hypothetical protein
VSCLSRHSSVDGAVVAHGRRGEVSLLVITGMDEDAMPENFEIKSCTALLWLDSDIIQTSVEGRARSLGPVINGVNMKFQGTVEVSSSKDEMWFLTFGSHFIMRRSGLNVGSTSIGAKYQAIAVVSEFD